MRRQNQPVLLRRDGADVLELQRVADDHGALGAKQQRQRRGDIALAGFIDHDQIEEPGSNGRRPRAESEVTAQHGRILVTFGNRL